MLASKPKNEELETYACILLEFHYEQLGITKGWPIERANRLCAMLRCTLLELGALCAVKRGEMRRHISNQRFPSHISLHFAMLESWALKTIYGSKQKPVMPVNFLHAQP